MIVPVVPVRPVETAPKVSGRTKPRIADAEKPVLRGERGKPCAHGVDRISAARSGPGHEAGAPIFPRCRAERPVALLVLLPPSKTVFSTGTLVPYLAGLTKSHEPTADMKTAGFPAVAIRHVRALSPSVPGNPLRRTPARRARTRRPCPARSYAGRRGGSCRKSSSADRRTRCGGCACTAPACRA